MPGDGMSWPEAVIASTGAVMVFSVGIVAIWQIFKTWQANMAARVAVAKDDAYRSLAEQATAAQQAMAEDQRRLADDVASISARLSAVEKLLRDVG